MSADCHNTAAMIPAAGNSGRMGIPKAFIKMPDGRTFLEQIVQVYFEMEIKPVVVVNSTIFRVIEYRKPLFYNDVMWVVNSQPEKGRMHSINMGLKSISDKSYCFIQNIDQPFATPELLRDLLRYADHADYIVPACQGRNGHPILINRKLIDYLTKQTAGPETLKEALEPYDRYCCLVSNPQITCNINTPDDYQAAFGVAMKE